MGKQTMIWKLLVLTSIAILILLPSVRASTLSTNDSNEKVLRRSITFTETKPSLSALCESGIDEAVVFGNQEFDNGMVERLNKKGLVSAIEPSLKRFVLYRGKLLLACSKEIHLLLANADVELAPNSMVYVSDNGRGTCVILNLHDEHSNAVKVHVGQANITLPPGRQLILTSWTDAGFDDVNLCCGIGFRSVSEFKPVPTIKAFCTQYSLMSATHVLPAVLKLAKSNTKEGNKMIKTAAAVFAATGFPNDFRMSAAEIAETDSSIPAQSTASGASTVSQRK